MSILNAPSRFTCAYLLVLLAFGAAPSGAQDLTQLGADIDGEAANDQSGESVSLSSDGSATDAGVTNSVTAGNASPDDAEASNNTTTATVTVNVSNANETPSFAVASGSRTGVEDDSLVLSTGGGNAVSAADPDSGGSITLLRRPFFMQTLNQPCGSVPFRILIAFSNPLSL